MMMRSSVMETPVVSDRRLVSWRSCLIRREHHSEGKLGNRGTTHNALWLQVYSQFLFSKISMSFYRIQEIEGQKRNLKIWRQKILLYQHTDNHTDK
ncbi:hypothetical protein Pelo_7533 [Pelomyxa schiedti]|nr:hypothetical protein Pelo_7533 [Pelomyxa schiedti]